MISLLSSFPHKHLLVVLKNNKNNKNKQTPAHVTFHAGALYHLRVNHCKICLNVERVTLFWKQRGMWRRMPATKLRVMWIEAFLNV